MVVSVDLEHGRRSGDAATCSVADKLHAARPGSRHAGRPHADVRPALEEVTTVKQTLALALFGDAKRAGDVIGHLRQRHPNGVPVVEAADSGAHGGPGSRLLPDLIHSARRLLDWLRTR